MNILENEIEDILFNAITRHPDELFDRGFNILDGHKYLRQVDLGDYGRADIIGFDIGKKQGGYRQIQVHIIELKKDNISHHTLMQALRYCRGIQRLIRKYLNRTYVHFQISLLGKSIDLSGDFIYCADIFPNVELYTYEVDFHKGISFKIHYGYYQKKESFFNQRTLRQFAIEKIKDNYSKADLIRQ